MASPGSVVIQFLVDAKKAATDAANLAKSFGKVDQEADSLDTTLSTLERELDSIARESKDLGDDMKRAGLGFDDVGDEAEQAADRVRRAARDMADGVSDGARGIDVETGNVRQNMKETGAEAGSEFVENIAEGIGSGQANLNDVVSGTLGGITNLAANLGGPVGIAAAGAAALIGTVFAAAKKQAEEANARLVSMNELLKDIGTTAGKTAEKVIFQDWIDSFAEMPGQLNQIVNGLHTAGITTELWRKAVAGSATAQAQVRKQTGLTAQEIIRAQKAHIPLTDEQAAFLKAQPLINKELAKQSTVLGASEESMDSINWLTDKTVDKARLWVDSLGKVKETVVETGHALDNLPDQEVNIRVKVTDSNGRVVAPGHIMPAMLPPTPPPTGPTAMTAGAAAVTMPPVSISVQLDQWGGARVTKRALEANDRQGRTPGKRLAVAW